MTRALKRSLFVLGGALGLLVLVAAGLALFLDLDRYRPRFEAAASDAVGMEVRLGGRVRMGLFPGLHVTLEDGRILSPQGAVVASARRARLWLALIPLLHGELRLRRVELTEPRISIERTSEGSFNVERLKKAAALFRAPDGLTLSVSHGTLQYADRGSGGGFVATGLDLNVSRLRLAQAQGSPLLKTLSLEAGLACAEIRTRSITVSDLKVSMAGKDGVFELQPVTMAIFGGRMSASLRADVASPVPVCQLRCSLPEFRIEEFFKTLSPKKAAEGAMDFTARLSMQGLTARQLVQSAAGRISLRGRNLILVGTDLDRVLSRFESTQNFNLVDVGAVFLAGPLGLAVTRGYDFAGLFRESGGTSRIGALVSDWEVEHGVARAQDVALATPQNRIALQGGLDLVNGRFADVAVAVVDAKGCVKVRQAIHGSFANPVVEKPRVLTSLAGPVVRMYRRARGLFPAGPCEVFYSGSVPPPR